MFGTFFSVSLLKIQTHFLGYCVKGFHLPYIYSWFIWPNDLAGEEKICLVQFRKQNTIYKPTNTLGLTMVQHKSFIGYYFHMCALNKMYVCMPFLLLYCVAGIATLRFFSFQGYRPLLKLYTPTVIISIIIVQSDLFCLSYAVRVACFA